MFLCMFRYYYYYFHLVFPGEPALSGFPPPVLEENLCFCYTGSDATFLILCAFYINVKYYNHDMPTFCLDLLYRWKMGFCSRNA